MNFILQCSCREVHTVDDHRHARHGRMTARGAVDSNGRVRYKCRNSRCGKTVHVQGRAQLTLPKRSDIVVVNPNVAQSLIQFDREDHI